MGFYFGHQSFNSDYANLMNIRGDAEPCSPVIMPSSSSCKLVLRNCNTSHRKRLLLYSGSSWTTVNKGNQVIGLRVALNSSLFQFRLGSSHLECLNYTFGSSRDFCLTSGECVDLKEAELRPFNTGRPDSDWGEMTFTTPIITQGL